MTSPHSQAPDPDTEDFQIVAEMTSHLFGGKLELWAMHAGSVESDATYAVLDSRLRYVDERAGHAGPEVALGTLTLPQEKLDLARPMRLEAAAIGDPASRQDNNRALAAEAAELPNQRWLVLVYFTRDVRWGLTEYFVAPITLSGRRMARGELVQVGRDSISAPRYFGTLYLDIDDDGGRLTVARTGDGGFARTTVLVEDSSGAFRSNPEH